jgi:hypothetical protein
VWSILIQPNQYEGAACPYRERLALTGSQAACLAALRARKTHKTSTAIEAKLAVAKTAAALRSLMFDLGELRIIDVTNRLDIPRQSMNALMQYLKRKRLVKKNGRELFAPYFLTAEGLAALTEMRRRRAA